MANIGFISLGCAKNQVDCERMMYRVQEAGHTVKADIVGSDVVVINTGGFIDSAKSEAIDHILQMGCLKQEGLLDGEDGPYGLYVLAVDGETVDESEQEWWGYTKSGEQVNYGVDTCPIADGEHYEFTLNIGW